jgi:putative redox protein
MHVTAPVTPAATPTPGPIIATSEVTWRGDLRFDAGPPGRQHRMDASAKEAPGPVEALLGSVAACAMVDVLDILAKRRTPAERLSVKVVGERRTEYPRRLMKLQLEFLIDGVGIEREQAERAIQLSFEKYCSAGASLAPDIEVQASLTLNGEKFPAIPQKVWTPGSP